MNVPKPFVKRNQKSSHMSIKKTSKMSINNGIKNKDCINMDDLMQFEAARQRALSQKPPILNKEKSLAEYVPGRVFINCIDTFNGSHLAEYLSNITREPEREDQDEGEFEKSMEEENEENYSVDEDNLDKEIEKSMSAYKEETQFSLSFEIIGSLEFYNNPKYSRPEGISELLDNEKKTEFLEKLHTCNIIIYDITSDLYCHPKQIEEAKWVLESIVKCLEEKEKIQPKEFSKFTQCRIFILISTLMTWAKTKPIDPEDPSISFIERDFRKRKPHPNYKAHWELEKRVIELGKKYPKNLKTIVIGSGIPYGYEEDVLHFLFKMAWQDAPFLPIFKPGNNIIPVIHINSLARIVQMIIENFPQKFKYIIATDPHSVTMKQVAKVGKINDTVVRDIAITPCESNN